MKTMKLDQPMGFGSATVTPEFVLMTPVFDFVLLVCGCICYVFAEVVNQAAILYYEQKLTV